MTVREQEMVIAQQGSVNGDNCWFKKNAQKKRKEHIRKMSTLNGYVDWRKLDG